MKSPRKPAPDRRRRHFLADPNYVAEKERERRRILRLQQVRAKSNEAARVVRQRVRREQYRQIRKVAEVEVDRYRRRKEAELAELEAEYQLALHDVGLGHEGLGELRKYEEWKADQAVQRSEVAQVRGEHALRVLKHRQMLADRVGEERTNLKKSVRLVEDARAAQVRRQSADKKQKPPAAGLCTVVEVVESQRLDEKRVRFEDDGASVRRIGPTKPGRPGIEAAIREEEEEEAGKWTVARDRVRLPDPCERLITSSFFGDESGSDEADGKDLAADVDTVPSRGPSEASDAESSSADGSSSGCLHAQVSRHPTTDSGRPVMGGPTSAFVKNVSGPAGQRKLDAESGKKAADDDDFVAKVLGGLDDNDVDVGVVVDEVSTLASTKSATTSSSSDLTKEKFLADFFGKADSIHGLIGRLRRPTDSADSTRLRFFIEKLLGMRRDEIADLSVTTLADETTSRDDMSSSKSSRSDGFASSTPTTTSIMSSASTSSSKSSKTVRFLIDNESADGSLFRPTAADHDKTKDDILARTKMSLDELNRYYRDEKRRIEAELRSRSRKFVVDVDKENLAPLSGGPLSSSSVSSTKSSSADSDLQGGGRKKVLHKKPAGKFDKSSSSGTSGSVATAELLSRLRRLEMPSLQRPHLAPANRRTSADNTSADILKASELEADDNRVVSPFDFGSDDNSDSVAKLSRSNTTKFSSSSSSGGS